MGNLNAGFPRVLLTFLLSSEEKHPNNRCMNFINDENGKIFKCCEVFFSRKITSSFIYLPKNLFSQINSLSEVPEDEINYRAMS